MLSVMHARVQVIAKSVNWCLPGRNLNIRHGRMIHNSTDRIPNTGTGNPEGSYLRRTISIQQKTCTSKKKHCIGVQSKKHIISRVEKSTYMQREFLAQCMPW